MPFTIVGIVLQAATLERRQKTVTLVFVVCAAATGILAKLALTTGPLLPGLDGAYYWVQVRSLLDSSQLAFDDLPLVFWVQAAIAAVVNDIPLAVRISDAVLPALSAIPIYLMTKNSKQRLLPAVAILVVLLHPVQLYFFTGDFIKNEAIVPVLFCIGWILQKWDSASKRFSLGALGIAFLVLGLSHFGTMLVGVAIVLCWGALQLRRQGMQFWAISLGSSLATLVVIGVGLAWLVPSRYKRLISLLSTPASLFSSPMWQTITQNRADSVMIATIVISQLGVIGLSIVAWRNRERLSFSHVSLVAATLFVAFFLSSPLIGMEWSDRLAALSIVPLSIAAIVIYGSLEHTRSKSVVWLMVAATLLASVAMMQSGAKQPILTATKYTDLQTLAEQVQLSPGSIVVAQHGVEYLAAWTLKTNVVQYSSYQDSDLTSYSAVYSLEEKHTAVPGSDTGGVGPNSNAGGPPDTATAPTGSGTSSTSDKPPLPADTAKAELPGLTGTTVYENDSFTLIKIR